MSPEIKALLERPWITAREAQEAKLVPLSLTATYAAMNAGIIPSIKFGKRKKAIPTAWFKRTCELGDA